MTPSNEKFVVGMIGLGYVGLSTAAYFVSKGVRVVGVDVDEKRVESLSNGKVPISEDGVEPLIRRGLSAKRVAFHSDYAALDGCDIVFIAVGTPGLPTGGIDTSYVEEAATAVARRFDHMRGYPVVVVKSTVTPSTTRSKVLPILERESGLKCSRDFGLATNPEFLREGKALWDMGHPDAIVIGKVDERSVKILRSLYRSTYHKMPPVLVTEAVNAEFVKYGVNSMRAVQLSYINTLANLCARNEGAKIDEVAKGLLMIAHLDKRYSKAGLGFGGSCLPKDTRALIALAKSLGVDDGLLSQAMSVNQGQAMEAISMAQELAGSLNGARVALLGLTFKAGTDDSRESVGLSIARALSSLGAHVSAFDPGYKGGDLSRHGAKIEKTSADCLTGSDCCIVTNDWAEFKGISPKSFKRLMKRPLVVDGRGLYDVKRFADAGVVVKRIGEGSLLN